MYKGIYESSNVSEKEVSVYALASTNEIVKI